MWIKYVQLCDFALTKMRCLSVILWLGVTSCDTNARLQLHNAYILFKFPPPQKKRDFYWEKTLKKNNNNT